MGSKNFQTCFRACLRSMCCSFLDRHILVPCCNFEKVSTPSSIQQITFLFLRKVVFSRWGTSEIGVPSHYPGPSKHLKATTVGPLPTGAHRLQTSQNKRRNSLCELGIGKYWCNWPTTDPSQLLPFLVNPAFLHHARVETATKRC